MMKKIFLSLFALFIVAAPMLVFAQAVSPHPASTITVLQTAPATATSTANATANASTNQIWINAAIVASIIAFVTKIKGWLEAGWLTWLLKLIGHTEVAPYISVALVILTGLAGGLVAYGMDGLTGGEIWKIIVDIIAAMGIYEHTKKDSPSPA